MANNLRDIYTGVKQNDDSRHENDFYPTPPLATYILHKYTDIPNTVVEPCAGRGNISVELLRHGYTVHSYDLHAYQDTFCDIISGQDVLELKKPLGAEGFITNPPYHKNLPHKIAEKGVSEYEFTALFVRLTFLEGKKRKKLFTEYPPSDIIFLSDRIRFSRTKEEQIEKEQQLGGMISYMWIVWDKKASHQNTRLRWVLLEDEYDEWLKHYKGSV
jgi:hypothetical protein